MIDSHCHLDSFKNIEETTDSCKKAGIEALITCGYSEESSKKGIELAKRFEGYVFPAVGVAPQTAMKMPQKNWVIGVPDEAVAIGEIGLDYHWAKTTEEKGLQKECFLHYLGLASELDLPVVIHCRDAWSEVIEILDREEADKIILHCFSGSFDDAKFAANKGWVISFPPIPSSTRKTIAGKLEVSLIVESDSPYIGKTPLDIRRAIEIISSAKNKKTEEVAAETARNARTAFGI